MPRNISLKAPPKIDFKMVKIVRELFVSKYLYSVYKYYLLTVQ